MEGARLRKFLKKFAAAAASIPAFAARPFRNTPPPTQTMARTGDARYTPVMARWEDRKDGTRVQQANRLDDVRYEDYDRARFYPVIRDGIRSIVSPASRANIHFVSDDPNIAELAQQELAPLVPAFIKQTIRGALEFGWHAVEIRWIPKFDVLASAGLQQGGEEKSERYYPFIWTVRRFAHFDPKDCRILIDTVTGDFGGIRQMVSMVKHHDVPGDKCLIYTHDREFDGNYGVAITKPAIPFVDLAVSLFDAMGKYADLFAVPGMIGRYPLGRTSFADGSTMENADLMQGLLEGIGAGHRISLPSNGWDNGNPRWAVDFFAPVSTSQGYTDMIGLVDDHIRMAIGTSEAAGSTNPDVGGLGDQGASDKIELHLQNIETYLDELKPQLDKLAGQFKTFNFGHDAPSLRVYFEPVDMNVTKALLAAVVEILSSGQPIQDADGNMIYPDWGKILQDKGIPTVSVSGKRLAKQLLDAAQQQIGAKTNPSGGEGGSAGDELVRQLTPDPEKPETELSARSAAFRLLLRALDHYDTAPAIRAKLKEAVVKLDEDFEGKHPRNSDGTFKTKEQLEAEAAAKDAATSGGDNRIGEIRKKLRNRYEEIGLDEKALKGLKEGAHKELQSENVKDKTHAQATLLAVQDLLDRKAIDKKDRGLPVHDEEDPAGGVSGLSSSLPLEKEQLDKAKAEKKFHEQSAWTRGRLPNVIEHDGDFHVVDKEGNLTPAKISDLMPKLRQKLEERGNEAYANLKRREAGEEVKKIEPANGSGHLEELSRLQGEADAKAKQFRPPDVDQRLESARRDLGRLDTQRAGLQRNIEYYEERVKTYKEAGYTTSVTRATKELNKYKKALAKLDENEAEIRATLTNRIAELEPLAKLPVDVNGEVDAAKARVWAYADQHKAELDKQFSAAVKSGDQPHDSFFDPTIWKDTSTLVGRYHEFGKAVYDKLFTGSEGDKFRQVADRIANAEKTYNEALDAYNNGWKSDPETRDARRQAYLDACKERDAAKAELAPMIFDRVSSHLQQIHGRPGSVPRKCDVDGKTKAKKAIVQSAIEEATSVMPERFRTALDRVLGRVYYSDARAHYQSDGVIRCDDSRSTMAHELMHAVEHGNRHELELSMAFLQARTAGERAQWLGSLTGNKGYGRDEVAKPDSFTNPYMGKIYRHASTEILSMGIEGVLHGRNGLITGDPDMAAFILGRLARKA